MELPMTMRAGDAFDRERWASWLSDHGLNAEDVFGIDFLDHAYSKAVVYQYDRDESGKKYLVNGRFAFKPDAVVVVKRHPPPWTPK